MAPHIWHTDRSWTHMSGQSVDNLSHEYIPSHAWVVVNTDVACTAGVVTCVV